MTPPEVFLRKTSGVVRALSPFDSAFYGFLTVSGIGVITWLMLPGLAFFPGANLYLVMILLLVFMSIRWVAYAMMVSSMPRSGGDYVFQSRLLRGDIGWAFTWGGIGFWQLWWNYIVANTIAIGVLSPMFEFLGHATNNPSMINAGIALLDPITAAVFSIVVVWLCTWVMVTGMRGYVTIQRYILIPLTLVSFVILAGIFLVVPRETFMTNFTSFQNIFGQVNPDWYHAIIDQAKELGADLSPPFSWYDTFGLFVLLYGMMQNIQYSMELIGEMKGVESFKTAWGIMFGAAALLVGSVTIGMAWGADYLGMEFIRAYGYVANVDPSSLAGFTWRGVYGLFTVITLNVPIGIILGLGWIACFIQYEFNGAFGAARFIFAASFDRILPSWMGSVNKRGAPVKTYIFFAVVSSVIAIVCTGYGEVLGLINLAFLAGQVTYILTMVSAIVFPWRAKKLWEASPGSKYKIGKMPVIVIAALFGLIMDFIVIAYYFTNPFYGVLTSALPAQLFPIIIIVGCFVWFYGARWYRNREGINIELAFKEVPPA